MKPQITIQDFKGAHNGDGQIYARLLKGGTWKKQRIIVLIPAGDTIPAKCALAMWNLGFPPNNSVVRVLAQGLEVGEAYSAAIESVLQHPDLGQFEYLLTVEHDNAPPSDGVLRLLERMEEHPEYACIGGLYFLKGPGGCAQIWGDITDPVVNFRPQLPKDGELVECHGTGMGFNLWRLKMFKDTRLRKPWFVTQTKGGTCTQDLYFWNDARKYGYRCAIDCSIKVGHYDMAGQFGPEDMMW